MPSVLSDHDKETVKRVVPKSSNKIQAVAVARLYVALPGRTRWTYTGLQGAAVLSNDLVGNTFWIKLVDISPANRGVIWDQEIYDTFQYNQDRTFFHSFELDQCMAALSYVDDKEAKQFKKKMDEREKNASKATKSTPFGSSLGGAQVAQTNGGGGHKSHGLLGGLFGRNRNTSNPPAPALPQAAAPQPIYSSVPTGLGGSRPQSSGGIDLSDPAFRPILDELLLMGITEDQISQNTDFIRGYIEQKQAEEMASGIASALPQVSHGRAPPPPPPPSGGPIAQRLTPDNTGSSGRRGPPPAPPPSRRPVPGRAPSPPRPATPERTPSPPTTPQSSQPRFRAPPPFADAGKFAVKEQTPTFHSPTGHQRASSGAGLANPGPPPPPRPPKEADDDIPGQAFRVPPPFGGQRQSSAPQPPPSRGPVPLPPPSRDVNSPVPPPPPSRGTGPPLPPPSRGSVAPIPPPLPPPNARAMPPPPSSGGLPPPPPPMPSFGGAPPPPPMPGFGGPPPPPLPPGGFGGPPAPPPPPPGTSAGPPLPTVGGGRNDLMAAIRGGSGGLKKVKASEKNDRSAAAVPGAENSAPAASSGGGAGAPADAGGLAGALQAALNKRKKKVGGSDDEKDDDDDW